MLLEQIMPVRCSTCQNAQFCPKLFQVVELYEYSMMWLDEND